MNAIHTLSKRLNTVLIMVTLCLLLSIAITWAFYRSGNATANVKSAYIAELLAHDLPQEAIAVMEELVKREPLTSQTLHLRKVMADILMDRIGDHQRALAELIYIKTVDPKQAPMVEESIRKCMNRLGRVYDVQRRLLLEEGVNPVVSQISSATAVKLGNEEALSIQSIQLELARQGFPLKNPPKEALDKIVRNMSGEILLRRAAKRSEVRKDPEFLEQVRNFESNLELQKFLQKHVLKDLTVDKQALELYMEKHRDEFESPLRVVFSKLEFADQAAANEYVNGGSPASQPVTLDDHVSAVPEALPPALKGIKWESDPVKGTLGPVNVADKWYVFIIHEVIPARKVPPELAREQSHLRLLEQKHGEKISEMISELAGKEELKIIDEVINQAFYDKQPGE